MNRLWLFLLLAWLAVLAIYGRSLSYPFVYDDHWTLERNPALKDSPLVRFFSDSNTVADPTMNMGRAIYRPIATLSYAVDARLGGLSPRRFRLENLLLHGLNGWLLILLLRRLGFSNKGALFGGALFLVHPAQIESVVWLTQRSTLLCLTGLLLGLLAYAADRPKAAAGGFLAALFSKETAVVFPGLMGAWDQVTRRPRWKPILAGLAAAVIFLLLRRAIVGELSQRTSRTGHWTGDLLLTGLAFWEYLKIVGFPAGLTVSHGLYVDHPGQSPAAWMGLAALAAWAVAAALLLRRRSRLGLSLAWYLLALLPVLGFLPLVTFVAERFLYMPLAGLSVAAAAAWDAVRVKLKDAGWILAAGLAGLAAAAFVQTGVWKDDMTLWSAAVEAEPDNSFARACLADALDEARRPAAAAAQYAEALARRPSAAVAFTAYNNLAKLENQRGRPGAALALCEKALALQPGSSSALFNKAVALALLGRKSEALAITSAAEKTNPGAAWSDLRRKILAGPEKR